LKPPASGVVPPRTASPAFPQPFGQDDLLEILGVPLWRRDDPQLEVPPDFRRVRVGEDLPLRRLEIARLASALDSAQFRWTNS